MYYSKKVKNTGLVRPHIADKSISLFIVSFCISFFFSFSVFAQNSDTSTSTVQEIPSHWKLTTLQETVFDSKIVVAEIGDKNKTPIVLIHGLGSGGLKDWINVVPALEEQFYVIALDLPGFGHSPYAQGKFSPRNYARVVASVLAYLIKGKKAIIVGHSMGGAVALRFSADFPDSVERLVLVDAAGILERTAFLKQNSTVRSSVLSAIGLQGLLTGVNDMGGNFVEIINSFPDPTKLIVNDQMWRTVFANRPNFNAGLALIQEDFTEVISNHHIPTYIIWGERDNVAPVRTAILLEKQLNNAELSIIPGAAHVPMFTHPQTFNKLLIEKINQDHPNVIFDTVVPGDTNLFCNTENGKLYQGGYKHIRLFNCTGAKLQNVHAESIEIINSIVELENVTIFSEEKSLTIENSSVIGTNIKIRGATAIELSNSRLDLAGASIIGTKEAIRTLTESRLIFSISKVTSPYFSGNVHGSFNDVIGLLDGKL